jgi:hypothetical protein
LEFQPGGIIKLFSAVGYDGILGGSLGGWLGCVITNLVDEWWNTIMCFNNIKHTATHGLPQVHKEEGPLAFTTSTIFTPTKSLEKHLLGLLCPLI